MKGPWTPEELSDFVKNPKAMVPGTNMTFAGIPRASERADLIAFLNSQVRQSAAPDQGRRGQVAGPGSLPAAEPLPAHGAAMADAAARPHICDAARAGPRRRVGVCTGFRT